MPHACMPVKYFQESKLSGRINEFMKSDAYEWKSEFRFAIRSPARGPLTLTLGDLSHITSPVLPIRSLQDLDFNAKEATQQGFIWAP